VLSVLLVFVLARRVTSITGAALAALIAAIMPASVAVDRSNLADSWLQLVLLSAVALTLSATDKGNAKRLALGSALIGIGFITKLVVAYLAIPAIFLTYLLTAPITFRRRLLHLALATVVVVLFSLVWPVAVDLTQQDRRPYIAETSDNSMLSLAFGFQGIGRMTKSTTPGLNHGATGQESEPGGEGIARRSGPGHTKGRRPSQGITGHGGPPGLLRLANRDMAGHIAWFLPVMLVGLIAMIPQKRPSWIWSGLDRDVLFWLVWLLTFAAVFSLPPTFIHPYYLTLLTPAMAILTALAATTIWQALERGGRALVIPAAAVVLSLIWHMMILGFYPPWARVLVPALAVAGLASAIGMLMARRTRTRKLAFVLGAATTVVSPLLWAATPALAPMGRMVPIADPELLDYQKRATAEGMQPTHLPTLVRFLQANRASEPFLLAVRDIHWAGPVILQSRAAVMAFGGYYGHEETQSVDEFTGKVASGQVRYVLLSVNGNLGQMTDQASRNDIEEWVKKNGTLVPAEAWQSAEVATAAKRAPMPMWGPTDRMVAMMYAESTLELYDCRVTK
jgi:4-amino-4-deoxy-L-arabinose transferase-like glycosyltransferase